MTLAMQYYGSGPSNTAADSDQGKSIWRTQVRGKAILHNVGSPSPSVEQRLANALTQAKSAIADGARDLGPGRSKEFRNRLAELLDPEDWDDDDIVLREASTRTMIRLSIAVNSPATGLTLTSSGNLVSTWENGARKVRVEALSSGKVSWAIVDQIGDKVVPQHQQAGTISGLQAALQA